MCHRRWVQTAVNVDDHIVIPRQGVSRSHPFFSLRIFSPSSRCRLCPCRPFSRGGGWRWRPRPHQSKEGRRSRLQRRVPKIGTPPPDVSFSWNYFLLLTVCVCRNTSLLCACCDSVKRKIPFIHKRWINRRIYTCRHNRSWNTTANECLISSPQSCLVDLTFLRIFGLMYICRFI